MGVGGDWRGNGGVVRLVCGYCCAQNGAAKLGVHESEHGDFYLLSGIALWLVNDEASKNERRKWARWSTDLLAIVVLTIAAMTTFEYSLGRNLGIDQLIVRDAGSDAFGNPGRPGPNTAGALFALALALLTVRVETKRGIRPSQFLALIAGVLGFVGMMGYLFSAVSFYRLKSFTGMAVHTSALLFLLSVGVLFSHPDRGFVRLLTRESLGGVIMRRALPAAFLVPIIVGWVRMEGQKAGLYGTEFGLAMFATANIVIFSVLLHMLGHAVDDIAAAQIEAEKELATAKDGLLKLNYTIESVLEACPLPVIALDMQRKVRTWNHAAERAFGWMYLVAKGRELQIEAGERKAEFSKMLDAVENGAAMPGLKTVFLTPENEEVPVTVRCAAIEVGTRGRAGFVIVSEGVEDPEENV